MHDLRLVGVHEDGQHLLLSDGDGGRYRLPLDEPLRAAARRDRPHLGQLQIELEGGLRPREVQALIRSGLGAEEVAERAGWTVEKVRRYEGPVLAEREHVAGLARQIQLRDRDERGGRSGGTSLAARVSARLRDRGVDPAGALWDSARDEDGQWTVRVMFPAGGRERTATWFFDVAARTVLAHDDEARWLSENELDSPGPIPTPHRADHGRGPATVYDVEAEGGIDAPRTRRRAGSSEPVDLMAAMRENSSRTRRRSRRTQPTLTTLDESPREDALPLIPIDFDPQRDEPPPAAHGPHPKDVPADGADAEEPPAPVTVESPSTVEDPATVGEPAGEPAAEVAAAEPPAEPSVRPRPAPKRSGRPSVPSWDDIMFGAKGGAGGSGSSGGSDR